MAKTDPSLRSKRLKPIPFVAAHTNVVRMKQYPTHQEVLKKLFLVPSVLSLTHEITQTQSCLFNYEAA